MITEKIAMADMVAQSIEKFAQVLPLDIAEIFTWYFEQKGVENPERFLDQEKLNKQIQTEQVQDAIQDINIKNQLTQVLGNAEMNNNSLTNNMPVPEKETEQMVNNNVIPDTMSRLIKKIKHNRNNNKKGGN